MSLSQGVRFPFVWNLRAQNSHRAISDQRVGRLHSVHTAQVSATHRAKQRDDLAWSSGSSLETALQFSGILAAAKGLDATFQAGGHVCPDGLVELSWRRPVQTSESIGRLSLPGKNGSVFLGPNEYRISWTVFL